MPFTKRPRPPTFNYWSKDVVDECKDKLLKHQSDALRNLQKWFCIDKRPGIALVSMPTGSGKTGVICCLPYFLSQETEKEGSKAVQFDKPVLVIAPNLAIANQLEQQILVSAEGYEKNFLLRREIVPLEQQRDVLPSGVKIERTSEVAKQEYLKNKEVVIANAQKFLEGSWEENLSGDLFKLVIVDEAHHFPAETWSKIIKKFEGHASVVFFTATPYRSDHQTVVEPPFAYHLSLKKARENQIIRCTAWHELRQDPNDDDRDQDPTLLVLEEVKGIQERKNKEQPLPGNVPHMAIAITNGTNDADRVVEAWNTRFGKDTAVGFHSGKYKHQLKKMMERIEGNDVKLVVVVDMLQEGFDHPPISIAAIITKIVSPVKFVQFIGRAQRVVRKGGQQESSEICADVVTHNVYQQKENYVRFENEDLIEP